MKKYIVLIAGETFEMKAIIPAAGYATRMWPLTKDKPKALLEMAGRKVLDYVVEKVSKVKNIDEIIVVSNSKYFHLFEAWEHLSDLGVQVSVLDDGTSSEEDRLGAVGDVVFALRERKINEDILIVFGDNLFSFDLEKFATGSGNVVGLFDVKDLRIARQMGTPTLNDKKIVKFVEKDETAECSLCSTGVYYFSKENLKWFFDYLAGGNNADRFGDFISWLCSRTEVNGYIFPSEDYWFDIGSIESYQKANEFLRN